MSLRAMLWALYDAPTDDLPAGAFRVLLALADHADDRGWNAFPHASTLAQRFGITTRSARRHLAALRAAGLIYEGDQRMVEHVRGDRRPVVYNLDLGLRGDSPVTSHDVTPTVTSQPHGVTERTPRGDSPGSNGVTAAVPQGTVLNRRNHAPATRKPSQPCRGCGYEHDGTDCPRATSVPPGGSLAALVAEVGKGL